ncbi:hypothetical protein N7449_000574, partial [Penicillium cf. viridicatum]
YDQVDDLSYTITDAPSPPPPFTLQKYMMPVMPAVWSVGNSASCKAKPRIDSPENLQRYDLFRINGLTLRHAMFYT